jgi:hypothetical protein
MGIRYIKIDEESQAVIQRVVAEQLNRGGEVFDLANEDPGEPAAGDRETRGRTGLTLVEPINGGDDASDMLVLDEDLLGFEKASRTDPAVEEGDTVPLVAAGSGRGLWVALLLVVLAVVLGGAAYLFSADLLPF